MTRDGRATPEVSSRLKPLPQSRAAAGGLRCACPPYDAPGMMTKARDGLPQGPVAGFVIEAQPTILRPGDRLMMRFDGEGGKISQPRHKAARSRDAPLPTVPPAAHCREAGSVPVPNRAQKDKGPGSTKSGGLRIRGQAQLNRAGREN